MNCLAVPDQMIGMHLPHLYYRIKWELHNKSQTLAFSAKALGNSLALGCPFLPRALKRTGSAASLLLQKHPNTAYVFRGGTTVLSWVLDSALESLKGLIHAIPKFSEGTIRTEQQGF